MSSPTPAPAIPGGLNVSSWLPKEVAAIFRRHVPRGEFSAYGAKAIEEKLRREGAFAAKQESHVAEVLKKISPESLPLLVAFAELLETRGAAFVQAKLDELSVETANAEKAVA